MIRPDKIHILDENYRIDDYFDISQQVEGYINKINNIPGSAVVGVIAPFGYGKTTFINQIKKSLTENSWRIDFDAWKYPNRDDLWEAFVLETVRQVKGDQEVQKMQKKISGKSTTNKYVDIITDIVSLASDKLGGINILDKFSDIFKKEPITKTYEFQSIIASIFDQVDEGNIYIVVEDIDRSGDAGIFFLETISYFFKNQYTNKKVIVLVPIGSEKWTENINSYLKSIDYSRGLTFQKIDCSKLTENIIDNELFTNYPHQKGQINSFLEGLFKEFPLQMTMRLLKKGLRESYINYLSLFAKYGDIIDFRLCLVTEFAKIIKNKEGVVYYEKRLAAAKIGNGDSIFSALIYCLIQENHRIKGRPIDNIYVDKYYEHNGKVQELHAVKSIDIRIIDYHYPQQTQVRDAVLYFTDHFEDEKNYFGVSNIYFSL